MDTSALRNWATTHSPTPVDESSDKTLSLTSKILRFRWNGAMTVGVGSDADGPVRINSILDGVSWFLARGQPTDDTVNVVLGVADPIRRKHAEHIAAIATLAHALHDGPRVRLWLLRPEGEPAEIAATPPKFTTRTPQRWNAMLMKAATAEVTGMAAQVTHAIHHPSFALYPKLTGLAASQPWQMRLDGLDIGRTGPGGTTLALDTRKLDAAGEPRHTWREIVGGETTNFSPQAIDSLVRLVDRLIAAWTDPDNPGGVLRHGQREHALEAHVLSGRLQLTAPTGPLGLAVPVESRKLAAAQFPTLWSDATGPPRYLDALLTDTERTPWAVELKDQDAGGGHGKYLRHGIAQAVLYRHFIRTSDALQPWFDHHDLRRIACRAALAFPVASPRAAAGVDRHRQLAALLDVSVIEFVRPGETPP